MANALQRLGDYIKGLTISRSGSPARRGSDPVLSFGRDFSLWNNWWAMEADDSEPDYAARLGDLSRSSLVMAAVRWVGNTLPEAPLMVKEPGAEEGESEEVKGHPLVELLRYPNPYYAGDSLWTAFAYSWVISGNVYFIKVRDGQGKVSELWYEPHWNVRPVTDDKRVLLTSGVVDRYELSRGNLWYPVPKEDVIHFKDGLDPHDPRYGLSFVGTILRELYGDQEAARFAARLSSGGGVPPWVMTIDPAITGFDSKQAEALEQVLYEKTAGKKKGRPMVVYGGKAERLGFTPEEMDVKMLRRLPEERFAAVTGIPAVVLELGAGTDHSIYNNVRQAVERAYEAYLIPLQRRIAAQLNLHLLPEFEGEESDCYVTHDLSKVRALAEDETEIHKRYRESLLAGGITLNEYRSKIGMPEASDGNVYYVPTGVKVVKEGGLGQEPEPEPPPNPLILPEGEREGAEAVQ